MNKILLFSEKHHLPKGAFDFACELHQTNPILLVGVFLPRIDYWNTILYYSYGAPVGMYLMDEDEPTSDKSIQHFTRLCEHNDIDFRIHDKENENVREEIKIESRFADLILMNSESFYDNLDEMLAEEYTNTTMHHAECPIMLIPEHFHEPETIILAYDGTPSSIFAIRQFAHLFPQFTSLQTILVFVNDAGKEIPYIDYLEEFAGRHFTNLTILKLETDPRKYFATWIEDHKNALLVTGAEGRSSFSRLFKKSFISNLLRDLKLPLFIAHR